MRYTYDSQERLTAVTNERGEQYRFAYDPAGRLVSRTDYYGHSSLPDHLHCIWTLPSGDTDFSTRWNLLKGHFSRAIEKSERITQSRRKRRERGVRQRRFWAHLITDQDDFNQHVDYIHLNPVKHGLASCPRDWPCSSFHNYVRSGIYPDTWPGEKEIIDTVPKGE